jgi:hypothetical protein
MWSTLSGVFILLGAVIGTLKGLRRQAFTPLKAISTRLYTQKVFYCAVAMQKLTKAIL